MQTLYMLFAYLSSSSSFFLAFFQTKVQTNQDILSNYQEDTHSKSQSKRHNSGLFFVYLKAKAIVLVSKTIE